MATNGNPVGSSKLSSAQKRIAKEQAFLAKVQIVIPTENVEKVSSFGIKPEKPVLATVVRVAKSDPSLFSFLADGAAVAADTVIKSYQTLMECRQVIQKFGG